MSSADAASLPPRPDGGSTGAFSSDRIGGFGYGLGVSIGLLLLITTLSMASYFCTRDNTSASAASPHPPRATASRPADLEAAGIDEATLRSYPKVRYSGGGGAASCCSICLSDYRDADVLRALPECGHLFHVRCVDPWLRLHPTCPLCRTSPLPSPLPTPLAEVVPLSGSLARRQQ